MDDEEVRVRTTTLKAAVCGVGEMVNDGLWLDYEICMYACTEEDNCRGCRYSHQERHSFFSYTYFYLEAIHYLVYLVYFSLLDYRNLKC